MAKKNSSTSKRQSHKQRGRRGRRGLRILLIFLEVMMILILTVGYYAVDLVGALERNDIQTDNIYVYNATQTEAVAQTTQASEIVTEIFESEEDNLQETNVAPTEWVIETTVAEEEDDLEFLSTRQTSNGYWNILVLGVDARANDSLSGGNYRADVIIICSINIQSKEVKMVSVYRDTVLKMYGTNKFIKINDAIFNSGSSGGSPEAMLSTLNYNLDLNITDIVVVNWAAVALAVNYLGGIELNITEEEIAYSDTKPSILNGYLTEIVENTGIATIGPFTQAGLQWCDGPRAVAYCRNRYTTGSDFNRTARQREVMNLMLERAKVASITDLFQAVKAVFSNIYTTLTLSEMYELVTDVKKYTIADGTGFPEMSTSSKYVGSFPNDNILDPVVPNTLVANVSSLHEFLFGEVGYQPSANVQQISAEIEAKAAGQ